MSETTPPPWRPGSRFEAMYREDVAAMNNFQDPSQEWRRLFSELLRHVPPGAGRLRRRSDGPRLSQHDLAHGRSDRPRPDGARHHPVHGQGVGRAPQPGGQHRLLASRRLPGRRVPGYIVVQLIGASLGGALRATRGQRLGQLRLELSGGRLLIDERHADGSRADARPGQRDPRARPRVPRTSGYSERSASVATSFWPASGVARFRGPVDEPRSHVRTRPDRR